MVGAGVLDLVEDTIAAGAAARLGPGLVAERAGAYERPSRKSSRRSCRSPASSVARVIELIAAGTLTNALARQVVAGVLDGEGTPDEVVAARGLAVVRGRRRAGRRRATRRSPRCRTSREKVRDGKAAAVGAAGGRRDEGDEGSGRRQGRPRASSGATRRRLTHPATVDEQVCQALRLTADFRDRGRLVQRTSPG